jgi:hypothetical protein
VPCRATSWTRQQPAWLGLLWRSCSRARRRAAEVGVDLSWRWRRRSGSVDFGEFEAADGRHRGALRDPEVIEAIEAAPNGVAIAVIEWSGPAAAGAGRLDPDHRCGSAALAARIDAGASDRRDRARPGAPVRRAQLAYGPFRAPGGSSTWATASNAAARDPMRDAAALAGITINGLAI